MSALNYVFIDPIRKRSPAALLQRSAAFAHDHSGGNTNNLVTSVLSPFRPTLNLPPSKRMADVHFVNTRKQLKSKGWDILPFDLDAAEIKEMQDFAFGVPAYSENVNKTTLLKPDSLPSVGRFYWHQSSIIRTKTVNRLLLDSALAKVAQDYLGCRPTLANIQLWLDPVAGEQGVHSYHYDNDSPKFLKFFIYLREVSKDSGAHAFIEGSHGTKPRQFRRSKLRNTVELLDYYGEKSERVFVGPPGMVLAEDTAGFHRATRPISGYRLLMQIQYSIIDIPHHEEFSIGIDKIDIPGIDRNLARIARKFVN